MPILCAKRGLIGLESRGLNRHQNSNKSAKPRCDVCGAPLHPIGRGESVRVISAELQVFVLQS